jgi:hypothetical protein
VRLSFFFSCRRTLPFVCTYVHHADVPLPLVANWLASCRVPGFVVVCTLMSSLSHLQRPSVSQQSSFCLVTPRPRGPCHDDQDNLRRALVTWSALRRTLADDPKTNVGTRLAASERSDRNWLRIVAFVDHESAPPIAQHLSTRSPNVQRAYADRDSVLTAAICALCI